MTSVTIKGVQFDVPDDPAIVAGAPMTEGQAVALAQTRRENVRNNFAARVEKALNGTTEVAPDVQAALQTQLNEYLASYQFGVRQPGAPRVVRDPVEKEMLSLAKADISKAYFGKYGEKLKGDKLNELAEQLLESPRGEEYNRRAKRSIADREKAAASVLDVLTVADAAA